MGRCEIRWASTPLHARLSQDAQNEKEKEEVKFEDQSLSKQQIMEEEKKEQKQKLMKTLKKKKKKKKIERDDVSVMERVCIGSLAGGIAGGFTNVVLHPIDTVKTKLQTRGASSLYSGPFDVISKVRINLTHFFSHT